jgi:tetratricopeptide (TPR) repeat protein
MRFHVPRILAERDLLAGQPELARARLALLLAGLAPDAVEGMPLLHMLAWALHDLGQVDAAAALAARGVRMARERGARLLLVDTLRVAALIAVRQERWDAAAGWLQEGVSLAREIGYPYGEARLLQVAGDLYVQMGQPELARERLEAALALATRLGARRVVAQATHAISLLR